MCQSAETTVTDIEDLVQLLGKVRVSLEAVYWDEMSRIQQEADASRRNDEPPPFEDV